MPYQNHRMLIALFILTASSVALSQTTINHQISGFEKDLKALQNTFQIPGMAVLIRQNGATIWEMYQGYADLESKRRVTEQTLFPIASVSKTFAAVLVMQQVEKGTLKLSDSVGKWLPQAKVPQSVTVAHLLSHTSEGEPGQQFLYSSRYGWLSSILEKATGTSYETLMKTYILTPLDMTDTLTTQTNPATEEHLATGYRFDGQLHPAPLPLGLNASSGLITSPKDLARFDAALDQSKFLSKQSFLSMGNAFIASNGLPQEYGYGFFVQQVFGEKLLWSYGQEDAFSCLFLKVPAHQLSLIIIANNNLLSDPARLIQGNLLRSRFALSFLRHFLIPDASSESMEQRLFLDQQEQIATVLQEGLFANYTQDMARRHKAGEQLAALIKTTPNLLEQGDLSLRHACAMFPPEHFPSIASFASKLDTHLSKRYPNHAYQLYYRAELEEMQGKSSKAITTCQSLVDLPNHVETWFRLEALYKLGKHYEIKDKAKARLYYSRLASVKWNYRGLPTLAKTWLAANPAP